MGSYSLTFKASVENILEVIEGLSDDPVPRMARTLYGTENFYRVRVGDYRVIYKVAHETQVVKIFYVRHRSVAYRGL